MSDTYLIISITLCSIATFLTRALPFLIFQNKKPNKLMLQLKNLMPLMIMIILIFYCLKDIKFSHFPYAMPEILSILVALIIHLYKRNALLSIMIATFFYMFLIQKVFST